MILKKENVFVGFFVLLYFIVSFTGIRHHELWLDEAHHFLLARDSNSIKELFQNTRYEGHPVLWNFLLYIITRFTSNPFWMQFLHIVIGAITAFIFLRNAPFSRLFKVLFIFGYFMVYEYSMISRNYMLGVLFLFLACSVFEKRHQNASKLFLYLILAANTHAIFTVVSFAFALLLLWEHWAYKIHIDKWKWFGLSLLFIGFIVAANQIIPPQDTRFFEHTKNLTFSSKIAKGFISLFKGWITIPDFRTIHFWNSNFIVNCSKPFAATVGLFLYFVPLLIFRFNRSVLFFIYTALIGTQIFFFVTQMSATRYDGMTFFILIVALWIEKYLPQSSPVVSNVKFNSYRFKTPIIYTLLSIQFFSGAMAYARDFNQPFSGSEKAAAFLKEHNLANKTIISGSCEGTSISPYLQKKIWFLCNNDYRSFCEWNDACDNNIQPNNYLNLISGFDKSGVSVAVLSSPIAHISKPRIWVQVDTHTKIRFLAKFDNNIVRKSNYYVYEIFKTRRKIDTL